MNTSLVLKNKFYFYFSFLFAVFLFIYLLYFLINGERGIISYFKIIKINQDYKTSLVKLEKNNNYLIDRINRLKTNSLDLDFLDEKIRENTGFIDSDELLIKFN